MRAAVQTGEGPAFFDEDDACAKSKVRDRLSGLRVQQFRQAVLAVRYWQQSIHLREKNIVGPTERSKNAQHSSSSEGRTGVFR